MRTHSHWSTSRCLWLVGLITAAQLGNAAEQAGGAAERFAFTRLVAHWSDYAGADYVDFIADAQPEIAQVGFYGAHFWSLAHTPQFSGSLCRSRQIPSPQSEPGAQTHCPFEHCWFLPQTW